jgi:4a-hydroxytetrahydrobiopterin dehydratase
MAAPTITCTLLTLARLAWTVPLCKRGVMSDAMSAVEVTAVLEQLTAWSGSTTSLERTVTAPDFLTGIAIVTEVARAAEEADHHPDIDIRWRRVRFVLSTHDAGGVTSKDVDLARVIDRVAAAHGGT